MNFRKGVENMTANELHRMVNEMRRFGRKFDTRISVENHVYELYAGLREIGRTDLANQLFELSDEIEMVDATELTKLGTFE